MPNIDEVLERLKGTKLYDRIATHGSAPSTVTANELLRLSDELTQELRHDLRDLARIPQPTPNQLTPPANLAHLLVAIGTLSKKNAGLTIQPDGKIDIDEPAFALTCARKKCAHRVRAGQRQSSDNGCCEPLKTDLGPNFEQKFQELASLQRADFAPNTAVTTVAFVNPGTLSVFVSTKRKR